MIIFLMYDFTAIDFSTRDPKYQKMVDGMKAEVILKIGKNIPNILKSEMNAYAFGAEFNEPENIREIVKINDEPTDISGISKAYHKSLRSQYKSWKDIECVSIIRSFLRNHRMSEFERYDGEERRRFSNSISVALLNPDLAEHYYILNTFPQESLSKDTVGEVFEYLFHTYFQDHGVYPLEEVVHEKVERFLVYDK